MEQTRTLHVPVGDSPIAVVIRVLGATAAPTSFRLTGGSCTLGAQRGMDIVVDASSVSRKHVKLTLVPEGVRVEDLGSRNGTVYLGQRIERAVLLPGAHITAGDVEIALELDSGELATVEPHPDAAYRDLVGESLAMRRLFARLERLEGTLIPVLVSGESGVGKELVARALHAGSKVASGPFVAINCGALPRELVASELFGHVAGAFTGAKTSRSGAFETAEGGTLFLDEVAELPTDVQPMLLRALETGEIRPVGSDRPRDVKVRVIAATNRVLDAEIKAGRFREDLFFRLAVVTLTVPPLRERREDVLPLAARFAEKLGTTLPAPVLEHLKARSYPGNARELRNVIQHFAALGELPLEAATRLSSFDSGLAEIVNPAAPYGPQKEAIVERFTRAYLQALLDRSGGNQTIAAKTAGLSRTYLGDLLAKHGLSKQS